MSNGHNGEMKKQESVAAIIQARMGSRRLPGKSLKVVYRDYSLLELVISRVKAAKRIDQVILVTSINTDCDVLVEMANQAGICVVRGSETDVLSRFVKAIHVCQPNDVVRICGDNPLVSPEEIDKLVEYYREFEFDYASNHTPDSGLPDGLGAEIVRAGLLVTIGDKVSQSHFREHVTSYIIENRQEFHTGQLEAEETLWCPQVRLDINTSKDLENVQRFMKTLPEADRPLWSSQVVVDHAKRLM